MQRVPNQVCLASSAAAAASAAATAQAAETQAASQTAHDRTKWVVAMLIIQSYYFLIHCRIDSGESGKTSILRAMIMTQVQIKGRVWQTNFILEYDP